MALINKRALIIAVLCAFAASSLGAVDTSASLQAEIQNMEKEVSRQGIPAAERHDSLVRLARLRQLSGDIEGAAKNWLEAAGAVPGQVDDDALLSCAYCLAAMGEFDRALAALEPLLSKSKRARFLDTSIKAIKSGDSSNLASLASNPDYAQMKSEIYFMLWKVSRGASSDTWRQRLIAEFPQTPEGRLAAGQTAQIKPSPFWLFSGGLDSLPVTVAETSRPAAAPAQRPAAASPAPAVQTTPPAAASAPSPAPAAASASAPAPAAPAPAGVRLQTGIYSQQANARAQAENLRKAGFTPAIETRNDKWAVTVPAGADTNKTIADLKAAGFESFPIR
jgi:cell division septation protein DedD